MFLLVFFVQIGTASQAATTSSASVSSALTQSTYDDYRGEIERGYAQRFVQGTSKPRKEILPALWQVYLVIVQALVFAKQLPKPHRYAAFAAWARSRMR